MINTHRRIVFIKIVTHLLMYWNLMTMKMSSVLAESDAVSTAAYSAMITTSGL